MRFMSVGTLLCSTVHFPLWLWLQLFSVLMFKWHEFPLLLGGKVGSGELPGFAALASRICFGKRSQWQPYDVWYLRFRPPPQLLSGSSLSRVSFAPIVSFPLNTDSIPSILSSLWGFVSEGTLVTSVTGLCWGSMGPRLLQHHPQWCSVFTHRLEPTGLYRLLGPQEALLPPSFCFL